MRLELEAAHPFWLDRPDEEALERLAFFRGDYGTFARTRATTRTQEVSS